MSRKSLIELKARKDDFLWQSETSRRELENIPFEERPHLAIMDPSTTDIAVVHKITKEGVYVMAFVERFGRKLYKYVGYDMPGDFPVFDGVLTYDQALEKLSDHSPNQPGKNLRIINSDH